MKRKKKTNNKKFVFLGIIIVIVVIGFFAPTLTGYFVEPESHRPKHCTAVMADGERIEKCVGDFVFKNLPQYPKDFRDVWTLVYYNRLQILENFTKGVDDSVYYLQPEFYESLFDTSGVHFYAGFEEDQPVNFSYMGIYGYGAYPMDFYRKIISEEGRRGGRLKIITFWHSSWGVSKYQGFNLEAVYPEEGRVASFDIKQDPEVAREHLEVNVEPKIFLLGPSWPIFHKNWAQKITININISPEIPEGRYYIGLATVGMPSELDDKYTREYRFAYVSASASPMGMGAPTIRIVLDIE